MFFHRSKFTYLFFVVALIVLLSGVAILIEKPVQVATENHELPTEYLVHLTDEGFEPKEVKIKTGSAVRFVNESSTDSASINSDDYPANKKYPGLNLGVFQKGSTLVHIFDRQGIYGYHDQYNPDHTGTIVVE